MDLGLKGKRVLITGSTRGIGLAAAKTFLEEGARVFINGVNKERLENVVNELKQSSAEVYGFAADVSEQSDVNHLFAAMDQEFGGLDILVNNAAVHHRIPWMNLSEEIWDKDMNINLKSLFMCSKKAVERMRNNLDGGVILNASSFAALIPSAGVGLYAATKAAIINVTKTMAAEFAPYHIRVNAYIPGLVDTDINKEVIASKGAQVRSQIVMNREGRPEEIAAPMAFLSSSKASYISGTALEISGGKFAVQSPLAAWEWDQ